MPQHTEIKQTAFVALYCVQMNIYYWRGCQGTARGLFAWDALSFWLKKWCYQLYHGLCTAVRHSSDDKPATHQQLKQRR
jgi:hypothetical protein